jgi:hypothetical protein
MNRILVNSSDLRAVGYDPLSKTLEIEFRDDSIYQYISVSELVYNRLLNASSKGKFFHAFIKDKYSYGKIR